MSSWIKWKGSGIGPRTNRVAPRAIPTGFNYDFFPPYFVPISPTTLSCRNDGAISRVSTHSHYLSYFSAAHVPTSNEISTCMLIYIIIYLLSSTPSTNCCQTAESNQRTCRQRTREIPLLPQCKTHTSIRVTIYEQAYTLKINTACDCTSIMYLLQYFILYLSKLVLWQVGGHSTEFDQSELYILYIHTLHIRTLTWTYFLIKSYTGFVRYILDHLEDA